MSTSSTALTPSVEHHSLHHAPILTAGVPNSAILLEFEDACEDFFTNAKEGVSNELKVIRIPPSFKDPIICRWILSDHAHISTLKFDAFMKIICAKFLSKQWEDKLLSKILRNHLCPSQDFLTWATKLQQQNCILQNTDPQLDEKWLCEQISVAIDMDLHIAVCEAKVDKVTSLHDFLDVYTLCNEKWCASESRTCSIIDESYWWNKGSNKENNYHPYQRENLLTTSSGPVTTSPSSGPPKLTVLEIEIIRACSGCFKCQKLYLSKEHITTEATKKTCEFPSGDNYQTLTWDYANKMKSLWEARKTSSSKPIASTSSVPSSSTTATSSLWKSTHLMMQSSLHQCSAHWQHQLSLEIRVFLQKVTHPYVNFWNLNIMSGNAWLMVQ